MSLLDAFNEFDAALDWELDDPFLADERPADPGDGWVPVPPPAAA
jgi:hypothetical protein